MASSMMTQDSRATVQSNVSQATAATVSPDDAKMSPSAVHVNVPPSQRQRRFTITGAMDVKYVSREVDVKLRDSLSKQVGPEGIRGQMESSSKQKTPEKALRDLQLGDKREEKTSRQRRFTTALFGIKRHSTPVGPEPEKPRSLRFTFSQKNTSPKPPLLLVDEIKRILNSYTVPFVSPTTFLIVGDYKDIKFEVEVCSLPRLKNLHGIRFKRLQGKSDAYKEICETIVSNLRL